MSEGKNVLVTGASGFIGFHAVPFLSKHYQVETFSLRSEMPLPEDLPKCDAIVYLSGVAHQPRIDPKLYYRVNRDMAISFAEKALQAGAKQFIYISSIKAMGEGGPYTLDEDSPCHPATDYGKSKLEGEDALLKLGTPEFKVSVIRPAVVYGFGAKGNIRKLTRFIRRWPWVPLGGIDNKRSMVYIGNLLALIHQVIRQQASGVFIAADDVAYSTSEIVGAINKRMERQRKILKFPSFLEPLIKFLLPGVYDRLFGNFIVDNSKTREKLDFQSPYTLETGLDEMLNMEKQQKENTHVST